MKVAPFVPKPIENVKQSIDGITFPLESRTTISIPNLRQSSSTKDEEPIIPNTAPVASSFVLPDDFNLPGRKDFRPSNSNLSKLPPIHNHQMSLSPDEQNQGNLLNNSLANESQISQSSHQSKHRFESTDFKKATQKEAKSNQNQATVSAFNITPSPAPGSVHSSQVSKSTECRICLLGNDESDELGELMTVCACKGSIRFTHFQCLKDSLENELGRTEKHLVHQPDISGIRAKLKQKNAEKLVRESGIRKHVCDICQTNFSVTWQQRCIRRPSSQIGTKLKCYFVGFLISILFLLISVSLLILLKSQTLGQFDGNDPNQGLIFLALIFTSILSVFAILLLGNKLFFVRLYLVKDIPGKKKITQLPQSQSQHQISQFGILRQ